MAVEIADAAVESSAANRVVEKKTSSKKRRQNDGDIPDGIDGAAPKDKKKKKKKKSKSSSEANGEPVDEVPMVVDLVDDDLKAEKKKKRKREEHTDGEEKKSKKDKKRRKSDPGDIQVESVEESSGAVKPSKKDKKKSKQSEDSAESEPTVKLDKKAKKEKKANKAEASEPIASSSRVDPSPAVIEEFLKKHSISIHGSTPLTPILSFDQLDIPAGLRAACDGFKEPTPIQACSWPATLSGQDVVGIAETGSGKTLAFGLPALARLLSGSIPEPPKGSGTASVLVVAPTRELAIQTHDTLLALGKPFGIASVAVFGGMDKRGQIDALRQRKGKDKSGATTRIIVGTPGRILDLVNDGACDLSNVQYLVLDEADRMLDKGFENDIRAIIGHTKQGEARQTLMFSATWPDAVRRLAASFQRDPVRVTVGSDDLTANSRVEQIVEVFDETREKDSRLLAHLRKLVPKKQVGTEETRILVFALYKKESSRVEAMLRSKGFSVGALHGDMSQSARIEALQNFKTGKTGLLVATDVAARGLDIPNVAAVINYTFPLTIEDYIHRIGRTGRGGKTGKSITFFTGDAHERALAGELARVLRESGFEAEGLKKFPMTIKKKTHSVYGAFFRDDIAVPSAPTKITFD